MALLACVANMPGNAAETLAGMTLGMRVISMLYFPVAAMGILYHHDRAFAGRTAQG